jgi:3-deoxy-D-manno-octulosonate 8-phosphate phosphatase (KDO 8-P phosphatase)
VVSAELARQRGSPGAAPAALGPDELAARARRLGLVLTDSDGVLTDGGVYYSESGEALRRFSVRDGMGIERLRASGVATAIITREQSQHVARRAEKLRLPYVLLGVHDKAAYLPAVLHATGLPLESLAFIGDDVNDLGLLAAIGERGLTAAPADAMPEVAAACHYRCAARGGFGAFRDFAEWILDLRRTAPPAGAASGLPPASPAADEPGQPDQKEEP